MFEVIYHSCTIAAISDIIIAVKTLSKKVKYKLEQTMKVQWGEVLDVWISFNPLNAELNPICYLLALLGAHHFLHLSRMRVKSLTLRLLMSYIYIWSTHS